jgi:hypothetical protein
VGGGLLAAGDIVLPVLAPALLPGDESLLLSPPIQSLAQPARATTHSAAAQCLLVFMFYLQSVIKEMPAISF